LEGFDCELSSVKEDRSCCNFLFFSADILFFSPSNPAGVVGESRRQKFIAIMTNSDLSCAGSIRAEINLFAGTKCSRKMSGLRTAISDFLQHLQLYFQNGEKESQDQDACRR